MNAVERVLNKDLLSLMDRLAGSVPAGCLDGLRAVRPGLRANIEDAEAKVAAARAALLEDYGRWRRALEDVENLWAVAAWRSAEEPAEEAATLAA